MFLVVILFSSIGISQVIGWVLLYSSHNRLAGTIVSREILFGTQLYLELLVTDVVVTF